MDRSECAGMLEGCRDVATHLVERALIYGDDASRLLTFLEEALEHETSIRKHEAGTYWEAVQRGRKMLTSHIIPQLRILTQERRYGTPK